MREKAIRLINQMTIEEKASLCSGKDFWNLQPIKRLNIPEIMVTDGPHGLRKQQGSSDHLGINLSVPATCFPTASLLASTWDVNVLNKVGSTIATEALSENVGVVLGPGVNIKRSPLCGRNFEYFSEDPFLSSALATSFIDGVQSMGVGASIKHFAVNNQEERRMSIDAVVDERALREIYLASFERAIVDAKPWTVMSAYNLVNGTYASENQKLLTDILRDEWGYKGVVVTDWGACNDRVDGLVAGLDLEMPGNKGLNDAKIVTAVKNGAVSEEVLDFYATNVLELILRAEHCQDSNASFDVEEHNSIASEVASQGVVLLKNNKNILPLKEDLSFAVIGEFAKIPRYQGNGSSRINPTKITTFYDVIAKQNLDFAYAKGYDSETDEVDSTLIEEAINATKNKDVVIVFAGLTDDYESEGFDRKHMAMPKNHSLLIEELSKNHRHVVVVLSNGSPIEMPWVDDVDGIVEMYLSGQATGLSAYDILFGNVNPSGKLAETFPIKLEDNPSIEFFPAGPKSIPYAESIYVGYRYYDTANQEVLFPFGFGLSYTSFEYSNLVVDKSTIQDNETLKVRLDITNTGKVTGKEVVQLYVRDVTSTVFKPEKELKNFAKVELSPNETKTVEFTLDFRSFAHFSIENNNWLVESGEFEILVGSSSKHIHLCDKVNVESTSNLKETRSDVELSQYYNVCKKNKFNLKQFSYLYKEDYPSNEVDGSDEITCNTVLKDILHTSVGQQVYNGMLNSNEEMMNGPKKVRDMFEAMIGDMPLRNLVVFSGGKTSEEDLQGMIYMMNQELKK